MATKSRFGEVIMTKQKDKVIIVGAGMAGLTAGAYLSKSNYDVTILEKNDRTGGLVSTFERDGFYFDTGPRAFVNSGMVKPILRDLGIEFEEKRNLISMAIEDQILKIESLQSINEYEEMLKKLYPESKDDIEKIIKVIHKLSKHTEVLYEFDNPYFVDYKSDKKAFFTEFLPWLPKLAISLKAFNKYSMPMEKFLSKMTNNQSLIDMLTQFFFTETPTYFTLGYFQVYLDYFYPKSGTGSLPNLLRDKVLQNEGNIQIDTTIECVKPSENIVVDSKGVEYSYDHLIWAADLKTFYRQVESDTLVKKDRELFDSRRDSILNAKPAESVFILFLAIDRDTSYFEKITSEHMFYTPSRKGLGETNRSVKKELIDNFSTKSKQEVLEWVDDFCSLNSFEISIPALRDSSLSPDGKTGIMASCLFDFDLVSKIMDAGYQKEFQNRMENNIIKLLSENIFKGIEEDILFKFSVTPHSISIITGNSEGGIVGWSFEGESPVHNRLKDLSKAVFTPFPNIYKASQWAYAPAGVPIAMLTAWHATQKIIGKSKKQKNSTVKYKKDR